MIFWSILIIFIIRKNGLIIKRKIVHIFRRKYFEYFFGFCALIDSISKIFMYTFQFGLCQYHSNPIHLKSIRVCPLVAPPTPLEIPRWKLIRQKKKNETVEPKLKGEEVEKDPMFLEIETPFFNYSRNKPEDG